MRTTAFALLVLSGFALDPQDPAVSFPVDRTVVWLDATRVLAFNVATPPKEDWTARAKVSDPAVVEVVREPAVLAGKSIGYLRVRGLKEGDTTLTVAGASIAIRVKPMTERAAVDRLEARIVAPVSGAAVWGKVHVGVELTGRPDQTRPAAVKLRLPDGSEIDPVEELNDLSTPTRRLIFELDADKLKEGPAEIRAVARAGNVVAESEPASLTVVRARPEALVEGECEAFLSADDRPEEAGKEPPRAGKDAAASGGSCVFNFSESPVWLLPLDVKEAGWHQMTVVARGDAGGGAFPSVGLYAGRGDGALTTVRLFDRRWRRVPVGFPVFLPAGKSHLALRFMNDYWVDARSDRNLYLDRFELLRLDAGSPPAAGGEGMMRMMKRAAVARGAAAPRALMSLPAEIRPSPGLWVAFHRPLDGEAVNGSLVVRGFCWWNDIGVAPAPTVHLLVNEKPLDVQCGIDVYFVVDRSDFKEGANTVRLAAVHPDGRTATSPVQTVRVNGAVDPKGAPRVLRRFTTLDPRWDEGIEKLRPERGPENDDPELLYARFRRAGRLSLELPEKLEGEFNVYAEGHPEGIETEVRLAVTVEADGKASEAREIPIAEEWWTADPPATLSLKPGPKRLVVAAPDGIFKDVKDGFVLLRSVLLRERAPGPDRSPPEANILYPPDGHAVYGADVVVVEAWDDDDVAWVDVRVDGKPMQLNARRDLGSGAIVFPLVLRDLEPGKHALSVRVADRAENVGDTREISFTVLEREPESPGPYARALRMLDRFGYGPEPEQLARILTTGEKKWLSACLDAPGAGDDAALGLATANLRGRENEGWLVLNSVVRHVLKTDNPARARFLLWTQNHFSTWIDKVERGADEWNEHASFARLGPAPFQELLLTSATSPAMLHYLDQGRSFAGNLNENYAREIMELHTLGVDGGYAQEDVTRLAHLLCGWNVADQSHRGGRGDDAREFQFVPEVSNGRSIDVLGMRFERAARTERFDRIRLAIEMLAAHPSTARHVCAKLAQHYVAMPAPDELVRDLAKVFMESGGDLKAVLRALSEHPAFWKKDLAPRLTSPLDYGVRLIRVIGAHDGEWALSEFLNRSGMPLFGSVTPDGFPEEDDAWANTNGLLQRWNFARDIRWWFPGLAAWPLHERLESGDDEALQVVVDVLAQKIVGRPLGKASNESAIEFLEAAQGNPWERVMNTGVFIARLPEANLR